MKVTDLRGTAMFVHNLSACANGTVDGVLSQARANNVGTLIIKVFDGEWASWMRRNNYAEFVQKGRENGFRIGGWWYSVGNWQGPVVDDPSANPDVHDCTIENELNNLQAALDIGGDFFIIDPEKEWCVNGAAHAEEYRQKLRARFPTLLLGGCWVPSTTGYWVGNPIETLTAMCDFAIPQVYCVEWGIPELLKNWLSKAQSLAGGKPVFPTLDVCNNSGVPFPLGYAQGAAVEYFNRSWPFMVWWDFEHTADRAWGDIATVAGALAHVPPMDQQPGGTVGESEDGKTFTFENGFSVHTGFKEFYFAFEGANGWHAIQLWGYPLDYEHEETIGAWTGTVQNFERARFEWHSDHVELGRVNAERLGK